MKKQSISPETRKKLIRQAFGAFATGVTVVTARTSDGKPIGFTANSFTSVSLDPALLLVCIAKSSKNYDVFSNAEIFSINILGEDQRNISNRFASQCADRFEDTSWQLSTLNVPHIEGAVAWFDCSRHNVIDAGDHAILIGRIEDFDNSEKRPLAYLRGHYLDLSITELAVDSISHHGGVRVGCVLESMGSVVLKDTENGFSLPMGELKAGFRQARLSLDKTLLADGIKAELGFLYSVFEAPSGNATWMIFQGETQVDSIADGYRAFDIGGVPMDEIAVPEMRSILRRFESEFNQSRFGLYVDGSLSSGQINPIDSVGTDWANYIDEN